MAPSSLEPALGQSTHRKRKRSTAISECWTNLYHFRQWFRHFYSTVVDGRSCSVHFRSLITYDCTNGVTSPIDIPLERVWYRQRHSVSVE